MFESIKQLIADTYSNAYESEDPDYMRRMSDELDIIAAGMGTSSLAVTMDTHCIDLKVASECDFEQLSAEFLLISKKARIMSEALLSFAAEIEEDQYDAGQFDYIHTRGVIH